MIDVSNRVYTNVKTYVQSLYQTTHFQNSQTATIPSFPSVSVKSIDNTEVGVELGEYELGDELAVESVMEIQVYSATGIDEARNIINAACDAMRGMSYTRTYGAAEIVDSSHPNLYRMVARFSRIVHGLSDIDRFSIS